MASVFTRREGLLNGSAVSVPIALAFVGFALNELASTPSNSFRVVEAYLGRIAYDGDLSASFPIGSPALEQSLALTPRFQHQQAVDAFGCSRSNWSLTGLNTVLIFKSPEKVYWKSPAGIEVTFLRLGANVFAAERKPFRLHVIGHGMENVRITGPDGNLWIYRNGILAGMRIRQYDYRVVCRGTSISTIWLEATDANEPLKVVEAGYNINGKLVSFATLGEHTDYFHWDQDGNLTNWVRHLEGVHFTYRDGLVASISCFAGKAESFRWAQNINWLRPDKRFLKQFHLCESRDALYRYEITSEGYVIRTTDKASGERAKIAFNPATKTVSISKKRLPASVASQVP